MVEQPGLMTTRSRRWVPGVPGVVLLQKLQELQSDTVHGKTQVCVSAVGGQGVPPPAGNWMTLRVRVVTQLSLVQVLQAPQAFTMQFTGQAGRLHFCVWEIG